jgi:hypothetical protein
MRDFLFSGRAPADVAKHSGNRPQQRQHASQLSDVGRAMQFAIDDAHSTNRLLAASFNPLYP